MKRRTAIATATTIVGVFAGCTSFDSDDDSGGDTSSSPSPTRTPTGSPTRTPSESATRTPSPTRTPTESPARSSTDSPTPTPSPSSPPASGEITETSFEIVENTCGTGRDEASVERGSDRITVRGTISGRNSCFTAELERVAYDADTSDLTVAVRSFSEATEEEACGQCLVDIDYRARVAYDASDPETVTVLHNGETV